MSRIFSRGLPACLCLLSLIVQASGVHAAVDNATPGIVAADTQLYFVAADYDRGIGLFIDLNSIDRSKSKEVTLSTVRVERDPGLEDHPRYIHATQAFECDSLSSEFVKDLGFTRVLKSGAIAGESLKQHERQIIPGSVEQSLWQLVCHNSLPAFTPINTEIGLSGAFAFYDALQEQYDDLLDNGGISPDESSPGRALYLSTRSKERSATSADDAAPLLIDYAQAAKEGSHQAMWRLAFLSRELKVEGGFETWTRRLADIGDARAQYMIAAQLQPDKPCDEAGAYLLKSAEQQYEMAYTALASFYENGICRPQNMEQAAQWYLKAARMGDFTAQYRLAHMYKDGRGLPQDLVETAAWLAIAASHSRWEQGADPDSAFNELMLVRLKLSLSSGITVYRERARALCTEDRVCALTIEDPGALP